MINCYGARAPVVLAIDEDITILKDDIKNIFRNQFHTKNITDVRVDWCGTPASRDFGSVSLTPKNTTAVLRLLKSRGGVDMINAK